MFGLIGGSIWVTYHCEQVDRNDRVLCKKEIKKSSDVPIFLHNMGKQSQRGCERKRRLYFWEVLVQLDVDRIDDWWEQLEVSNCRV